MKLKRTACATTACMLSMSLVMAGVPMAAHADDTAELQQRVNDAYATLQSYTMELELASGQLATVQQDLADIQTQIEETRADIEEKKEEVAEGQKVLADRASSTYKQGGASLLSVVLGSANFDDLFSRIFYANKVADADAQVIDEVKTAVEELRQKETELAEQEAEQQALVAEQETKTAEVASKVQQQQAFYSGLDTQLKDQLAQEAARKAAEEEAARKAAEEAAKQQEQNQNNPSTGGGTGNDGGGSSGGNVPSKPTTPPSNNGNTDSGNAPSSVVDVALAQVGKPYVWGAGGPNAFDCSGLTSFAYAQVGYSIPHQSQQQFNVVRNKGHLVYDISSLKPGDLVFWGTGGNTSKIYHVGIYTGGGRYVHASMPGVGVVTGILSTGGNYVGGGSPV